MFWEDGGGTEAQILKDGDLLVSRRFEHGWQTLQWTEEERKSIEQGGEGNVVRLIDSTTTRDGQPQKETQLSSSLQSLESILDAASGLSRRG